GKLLGRTTKIYENTNNRVTLDRGEVDRSPGNPTPSSATACCERCFISLMRDLFLSLPIVSVVLRSPVEGKHVDGKPKSRASLSRAMAPWSLARLIKHRPKFGVMGYISYHYPEGFRLLRY
ncbi:hypothetical protein LINGRAHAP2_LOCUS35559, partial [Linum grandiflorum]